jgi:NADPH:quinone reductase
VTVRSDEKAEALREHGAHLIVNSRKTYLREVFDTYPIDLVLDPVGGSLMGACLGKLARHGRWIMIATLGGDTTEIDLKTLYVKRLRLIGSTLRSRTREEKAALLQGLVGRAFPRFERGEFRPVIYRALPIGEVEEAHRILQDNENVGKVVLTIRPE